MPETQNRTIERDKLLTTSQAASYLGVTKNYLERLRVFGTGPVFIKSGRQVRYDRADLDEWRPARRCRSTSDNGATA
ncbi:MAG: helix-turn-helix domain-containing protein [Methylobacterium sp.]|uniref:helix-turn-helix transcriptional regulator n=1 Tax=Methylobacterium sp. TaxID=409 RepID=UPI00338F9776|nr:helix-turn-helix domain-containing protein [Methylobacterium sp.]